MGQNKPLIWGQFVTASMTRLSYLILSGTSGVAGGKSLHSESSFSIHKGKQSLYWKADIHHWGRGCMGDGADLACDFHSSPREDSISSR